jgi:ABC-type branched-subunit amino acid transport system ATPase component
MDNMLTANRNQPGENPYHSVFNYRKIQQLDHAYQNQARMMLEAIGLSDKETMLTKELSYGEQKLIALGRLLLGQYDCLLLDEPASGVSQVILEKILTILQNAAQEGKILVIIEHNMEIIKNIVDQIYFLDHGVIIARGTPKEVLNDQKVRVIYAR